MVLSINGLGFIRQINSYFAFHSLSHHGTHILRSNYQIPEESTFSDEMVFQ